MTKAEEPEARKLAVDTIRELHYCLAAGVIVTQAEEPEVAKPSVDTIDQFR